LLEKSLKEKRLELLSLIRGKLEEIENTEDIFTGFSRREGGLNPEMIVSQIEIMAPQDRVAL
jgi:hypothetical protein